MRTTRSSPALTLTSVLLGVLAVAMSVSGTAVAVADIGGELRTSGAPLQWVVAGYNLTFAAFTLVCGSLADLFGRRRLFVVGATIFAAGNLVSALAPGIVLLDVARLATGIGGAALMASGGALLATTFDGTNRTRAFAAMGTMAGVGVAIGPSLSGLLVGSLGWRGTFLVFVLVGALILLGTLFVAESRADHRPRVDWLGSITFVAGLALVMYAVIEAPELGWGAPLVLGGLIAGLALLVVFVAIERRTDHPVLDLRLVGHRGFMAWSLGTLTTSLGFIGVLVFLPTYLQGVQGASVQITGLTMLLLTAPVLITPPIAGWLVTRGFSARGLIVAALVLVALGNGALVVLSPGVSVWLLAAPLLAIGIGMGTSFGITDGQAMSIVEPDQVGMAAGFLNTLRGAGEALMIAIFGSLLATLVAARVGSAQVAARVTAGDVDGPDADGLAQHLTGAWHTASLAVGIVVLVTALVVLALLAGRAGRSGRGGRAGGATSRTAYADDLEPAGDTVGDPVSDTAREGSIS